MLRKTGALACVGWIVLMAGGLAASAAPISTTPQTATIPTTQTDWGPTTASLVGADPAAFTKFDPTLGKLESVNLSLAYTYNHDVTMSFINPSTITVTGDSNRITVQRPNGSEVSVVVVPDYSVSQTSNGPTFPKTVTLPTHTTTGTSPPITLTTPADLALFTHSAPGDTLIKLPFTASAHSSFTSNTSNGGGGSQVSAGLVATLSYTYEPVPEPSTLAAFALGIGGYLLARRNRRADDHV